MEFSQFATEYLDSAAALFERITATWVLAQIAGIALAAGCAWLLTRRVSALVGNLLDESGSNWLSLSRREVLERVAPVIFLAVLWLEVLVFRQVTWTSNTFILSTTAKLTTAWIVVNILASVIRNRFVFRVVSISLWVIAALSILRLLPAVTAWMDGVRIDAGETSFSLLNALTAIALFGVLVWGVGFLSRLTDRGLRGTADISPSIKVLLGKLVRIVLTIVAIVVAMSAVGIDLTAFAVFSGAVGVGIGFGLQKSVSNFVSGISLLMDKSIKPGDVITVGDTFGRITQINTRYTSVITADGREYLIPNETMITEQVVNWSYTDDKVRIDVPFGVSYEADPHRVKALVEGVLPQIRRIQTLPAPVVHFEGFGESSLDFVVRFWLSEPSRGLVDVKSEVMFAVWDVLKQNGIEIPYPKRDIYAPKGLTLRIERDDRTGAAGDAAQSVRTSR